MDKEFIKKMQLSITNMRRKVIEAKGEAVKGLSQLPLSKDKKTIKTTNTREANA